VTQIDEETIFLFLVVLARTSGLMLVAPLFGARLVTPRVRAALALGLAVSLFPAAAASAGSGSVPASAPVLLVALGVEATAGYALGLVAALLFAAVRTSGQLAGVHMGIGIANLVDPQTMEQITPVAEWLNMTAMLVFLAVDGHHLIILALAKSFDVLPAGVGVLDRDGFRAVLAAAGHLFDVSVRLAAPVLVVLLLTNGVMGVMARMIPQLNVFIVGFPINLLAALLVLGIAHPFVVHFILSEIGEMTALMGAATANLR